MTFSHRVATLAAVVLIPVGIAGTSYLLSDDTQTPQVPAEVDLQERQSGTEETGGGATPDPGAGDSTEPTDDGSPSSPPPPREDVVPLPSATEGAIDDNPGTDDDRGDDAGEGEDAGEAGEGGDDDGEADDG